MPGDARFCVSKVRQTIVFLLVEEAFDGSLRGFLEGFFHHFHFCDLAVGGEGLVGCLADLSGDGCLGLLVHVFGELGVDECRDFAVAVHHKAFINIRAVGQDGLDLFRIDVLARRVEDHRFDAAADEDVAFHVDDAQVAGAEPSVLGKGSLGGLGVLVVADGEVAPAGLDFAGDVVRVVGVDAQFVDGLSAGAGHKFGPPLIAQQRAGLGHAIAHGVRQADLLEALLGLGVERRAAHDEALHGPAEGLDDFVARFAVNEFVQSRDGQQRFGFLQRRLDGIGIDFFHHQGHRDHHVGLDVLHRLEQGSGRRGLAQEIDGNAIHVGVDELDGQAVHVRQGQHRHHGLAGSVREVAVGEVVGVGHGVIGEHHALGVARGS